MLLDLLSLGYAVAFNLVLLFPVSSYLYWYRLINDVKGAFEYVQIWISALPQNLATIICYTVLI